MGASSHEFLDLQAAVTGRYSLEREIGRGGMGIVFLARDVALERLVAIKLLPQHLARDDESRERFLREARTAAQLMHPNIVPIHAVEARDDVVFFVMAFVDGETLTERVHRTGVLAADDAIRIMQDVAWALGYAHGHGIVHRDIKPDNILLEHASGRAMVADFGIARVTSRTTLSAEGALMGTVQYMSPEQAGAEELDGRSDVYSLGASMYFALSGSSPVEARTIPAMLSRLMSDTVTPVATARPDLPSPFASAVMRCLAKQKHDRFATADVLAAALRDTMPQSHLARPEVRAVLRELHSAKIFLIAGLGGAPILAALIAGDILPRAAWPGVFVSAGAGLYIYGAVVLGMVLQASRAKVPLDDLVDAITDELDDMRDAAKRGVASQGNGARVMQAIGAVVLAAGPWLVYRSLRILEFAPVAERSWPLYVPLALGALATLYGAVVLATVRKDRPIPGWLGNGSDGSGSGDIINAWPLRVARWFMRLSVVRRIFAAKTPATPLRPSVLPTATLLLQRVQELMAQLPPALQERLAGVLPAAEGLERAISALRSKLDRLDAAIAELSDGDPARAEFSVARAATAETLEQCVQALEALRTDCLRLNAGLMAADGVTAELERAQQLSARIDAELFGIDAVRRLDRSRVG